MLHYLLPLAVVALSGAPNLLDNSGFEMDGTAGWKFSLPAGTSGEADADVAHAGKAACRLAIPESAAVTWYMASREALPAKRGASQVVSAYVRTKDVRDGVGAYVSVAFFNASGKRLAFADSAQKLKGTNDWQRLTATAQVPDGASTAQAVLVVHGRGTAWFDDVQLEDGTAPTAYRRSPQEVQQQAEREAEAALAATWARELPARKPGQARVAILDERFPAGNGHPSDPAVLERSLAAGGYAVARLSAERLANPAFLTPSQFDLLVIPTGDAFPAGAHRALVAYLRHGGAMVTMGGYALDRVLVHFQGAWSTPESLPVGNGPAVELFREGTAGWSLGSNRPQRPVLRAAAGPSQMPALELHTEALGLWDVAISPSVEGKLPADWSVTRFWAKGDARTPRMEVEWNEDDGARWWKVVPLSTEWKQYTFFPGDFNYRADSPSAGRGHAGDQLRPSHARRFQVGVSAGVAERGAPHSVWIAGVRVQADAAGELRKMSPRINTRWARIRDALWPEPEQIGVFDSAFSLRDVTHTRAAAGQTIVGDFTLDSPLSGYSAVAMLGLNGHGFGPNRARWLPLLECFDRFGRSRGHAGAVVHHFTGTFAGSSWAIFGASDRDLFGSGSPALDRVLLPTVAHLLRRCYLHETDTALASYRDGETVTFRTQVSNFGRTGRTVEVRLVLKPQVVLSKKIDVPPGETLAVELPWKPGKFTDDYYAFAAELWEDGRCVDREESAFVAWSPSVVAAGPRVRKDGTRFLLDGRPQFLMGCQNYWGQNGSVTARSPAAFDRDFRQMRDCGLRWTRCFIPFKTEDDKRISDAIVQLAQKHGLVLYHTPNLHHTADAAELAAQQETSREIAQRYRDVPGLVVDICNEPSFRADNPGLVKSFGRAGKTEGPWDDLDVAAFWRRMTEAEQAWAKANRSALRAGDPEMLVSVGWSQGWGGGQVMKDPLLASLDLDFTDRHYYGPPGKMPAELKDVDLRGLGKPLILGECGAKDHPTFLAADPWGMGDDDDHYDARFLSLGHHTLGLGAAVMSSWHWRDPMEGIFPCGIVHQTGVPRPTALLYRAMALAFGRLKPRSVTPEVCLLVPDEARMNGQRGEVIQAIHRAADLLVASRVDFWLLPDSMLASLPKETKAIVYPTPLNPSDAILQRLGTFVEAGGTLYLSGDIGYDQQRRAIGSERLRQFCGVEKTAPGSSGFPAIRVKLAGAEAVKSDDREPTVTRYRRGKGSVWFGADPVELAPEMKPAHRDLYRTLLQAAGTPGVAVTPDQAELQVFRVPGEDADALVLRNGGPAVEAQVGEYRVELAANGTGFLLVGHDGALRAVESQGSVKRGNQLVAQIKGHAFVVAFDDVDVARSRSLLVLPLAAGEVRIQRQSDAAADAEVGEMHQGTWRRLATLTLGASDGQVIVPVPAEYRREMIRVVFPGKSDAGPQ
ncbi:MAG: hypothetical protein ABFD16_21660 [Thermoguttaceae bacterium]